MQGVRHIGTSGWSYQHWAGGRFYPKGLKSAGWLPFYAEHFSTVEVNMTFYRLPKSDMILKWRELTRPEFTFTIKLWRQITHLKRLRQCEKELEIFFSVVNSLRDQRGALLIQLPPSSPCAPEVLNDFLALARQIRDLPWRMAVEFRNAEWLCTPVYDVLDRHDAAIVLQDKPDSRCTEPNAASFVYIRRHGPDGDSTRSYTLDELTQDAEAIRNWQSEGRDVYVYFDNDGDGHAVDNAAQLARLVDDSSA